MPVPAWAADYVGIPFLERGRDRAGCDCWGLVRLVLAERFGVAVPSYAGDYARVSDHARLAELVEGGRPGFAEAAERQPGDVVLLRLRGLPIHVGLIVAPRWMLHSTRTTGSVLDRYGGLTWKNRIVGVYRHEELASAA